MTWEVGARYVGIWMVWEGESGWEGYRSWCTALKKFIWTEPVFGSRRIFQTYGTDSQWWRCWLRQGLCGGAALWLGTGGVRKKDNVMGTWMLMEQPSPSLQTKELQGVPGLRGLGNQQIMWAFCSCVLWSNTYFAIYLKMFEQVERERDKRGQIFVSSFTLQFVFFLKYILGWKINLKIPAICWKSRMLILCGYL